MGGAFTVSGNVNPACEANFFNDPVGADVLCQSGCPLRFLGLDVTQQARITEATMQDVIGGSGSGGAFIAEISGFYLAFNRATNGCASLCFGN